jgi:hypothetical protein
MFKSYKEKLLKDQAQLEKKININFKGNIWRAKLTFINIT